MMHVTDQRLNFEKLLEAFQWSSVLRPAEYDSMENMQFFDSRLLILVLTMLTHRLTLQALTFGAHISNITASDTIS